MIRRRWIITTFLIVVGLYLAFGALLWSQQTWLFYPAPDNHGALPAEYVPVELTTDDGLTIAAAFAQGAPDQPIILHFHGNGGNLAGASYEMGALADAGYGRLLVTYRGYGGNPGTPSEQGFYEDGRAALRWLAAQGVTPDRIVMSGNSIGSGTATQMALEASPAALILTSPFTSLPAVAGEKMRIYPVHWMIRDRFANAAKIARIDAPVLVLHGGSDRLIPPAHGRALADLAQDGEFILIEELGHDLTFHRDAQQLAVDWLGRVAPT